MTDKLEMIVTQGFPGAGKTTRAVTKVRSEPGRWARVNRDSLRMEMFAVDPDVGVLDRAGEVAVQALQITMVNYLLESGRSVIIDDTNLKEGSVDYWRRVAEKYGAAFTLWDMRDVDVETCIERDLNRAAAGGRYVGEKVIRMMAERMAASWQS